LWIDRAKTLWITAVVHRLESLRLPFLSYIAVVRTAEYDKKGVGRPVRGLCRGADVKT